VPQPLEQPHHGLPGPWKNGVIKTRDKERDPHRRRRPVPRYGPRTLRESYSTGRRGPAPSLGGGGFRHSLTLPCMRPPAFVTMMADGVQGRKKECEFLLAVRFLGVIVNGSQRAAARAGRGARSAGGQSSALHGQPFLGPGRGLRCSNRPPATTNRQEGRPEPARIAGGWCDRAPEFGSRVERATRILPRQNSSMSEESVSPPHSKRAAPPRGPPAWKRRAPATQRRGDVSGHCAPRTPS
jgi:hypothetical protein